MATLGERLKREREVRGVSLSEISQATNIQNRHLSALEENDFDALPGPVFVTGFLRAYSHHLGLDADKLVIEYESLNIEKASQPEQQPSADANKGRFSAVTIIVVLSIATFLLYLGWSSIKPEEPSRSAEKPSEIKKLAPPKNLAEESAATTLEESSPPEIPPDTPEIETPKLEEKPEQEAAIAAKIVTEPANPPPPFKKPAKEQMKTKYRLVVFAKDEDVWVLVNIDGETTHDLFVRAGRSIALRADKSITLTSGNAKSMRLTLNGKPLDFKTTPNVIREWSLPLPE